VWQTFAKTVRNMEQAALLRLIKTTRNIQLSTCEQMAGRWNRAERSKVELGERQGCANRSRSTSKRRMLTIGHKLSLTNGNFLPSKSQAATTCLCQLQIFDRTYHF
jgi:hypothetical protein